jgi:hypothetical protein
MVNLRLSRRPQQKQQRLRNVLIVGLDEDRNEFLDYLEIDVKKSKQGQGKNYKWKNRNLMSMPYKCEPRYEVITKTDVVIYFVDCQKRETFDVAMWYSNMHLHVTQHMIVAVNYDERKVISSKFFKKLEKYVDVSIFDSLEAKNSSNISSIILRFFDDLLS